MINFEEAKKIAKNIIPDADYYTEESKCYVFHNSEYDHADGGDTNCVIAKSNGECLNFLAALHEGLLDEKTPQRNKLTW